MEDALIQNYLESCKKQFEYYKVLAEKTFSQLEDDHFFWTPNEECNSIAVLVQHLHGNMLSRWTDFLKTDGEKEFRKRDEEFENIISTKKEMLQKWDEGWACLFNALDSINSANFRQLVYIRNEGHTITEAIQRQLTHYIYHIGQVIYIGKVIASEWTSLTIPKNKSKDYNHQMFNKPKQRGHFTDNFLEDKKSE